MRFLTTEDALIYAFRMEAMQVRPPGGWETSIPETAQDRLTPYDRIAEGLLIKRIALEVAGLRGRDVLVARYTLPADDVLSRRKADKEKRLAQWLSAECKIKRRVCSWIVHKWTGERDTRDSVYWARILNRSPGTVRYWRKKGMDQLRDWQMAAEGKAEAELASRGLIASANVSDYD